MKQSISFLLTLLLCLFGSQLLAQDFLSPLGSNPSLFQGNLLKAQQDKLYVSEDSIVYEYDTLKLPFIDDFTSNHLSKRIENLVGITDTTVYRIYNGALPDTDSNGYRIDSTFYYQIGSTDSILLKIPNNIPLRVHDLASYPTSSSIRFLFAPYNIYDTINKAPDTVRLPPNFVQDSARFFLVPPDSNDWYIDRDVLINGSFPLNPPSVGVATFDGLNQYGLPYSLDLGIRVKADKLTSLPIDLSAPQDSVYFSFFYQPKGLSLNGPEAEDSLVLEFFDASKNSWGRAWGTGGFASDTFKQVMLAVDTNYHDKAFQFRFRAYAQGSGAYDHWHVDYIYLDENRSFDDTTYKDIAFLYPAKPLLKDYYAMPWWHFKSNPSIYETQSTSNIVSNKFDQGLNVYFQLKLLDSLNNSVYFSDPGPNSFRILRAKDTVTLKYNVNYDYQADSVKGPGKFEALYHIDFRPGPSIEKDFILANDTLKSGICLDNYYAYDDGSAEAGYGINPALSAEGYVAYVAQKFEIPFPDTIGGVQLYFLPQFPDIRAQNFELMVWNNLNPAGVIFDSPQKVNPIYEEDNGFITYWFDSSVVVNQVFYVGYKAVGLYSLNMGYDLNTNNRNQLFWSFNGSNWNIPSANIFDGTLMMRPVFRKKNWGVGMTEIIARKSDFSLFPNPAKDEVQLELSGNNQGELIRIFDMQGRMLKEEKFVERLNIQDLKAGLYFLQLIDKHGNSSSQKLIKH